MVLDDLRDEVAVILEIRHNWHADTESQLIDEEEEEGPVLNLNTFAVEVDAKVGNEWTRIEKEKGNNEKKPQGEV